MVHDIDLKSLKALREDGPIKHSVIVCQESYPRVLDGVKILPWQIFLEMLWNKEFGI